MSAPAPSSGSNNKKNHSNNTSNTNTTDTISPAYFSASLFSHVAALHPQENVIVSPLLLEAALALLFLGSDGSSAEELKSALQLKRFGSNSKMANYYADVLETFSGGEETRLLTLQRILLAEDVAISEEFKRVALKYFHTTAENIALSNKVTLLQNINSSLQQMPPFDRMSSSSSSATEITEDLLFGSREQTSVARALVLNVACFQSKWFLPFSAYRSGSYDFCTDLANGEQLLRTVPMMYDDDMFVKFGEFRELDARAIELPYEHEEELAMLVVLPNRRDGLNDLEQLLSGVDLCVLVERMQMESVQVLLPKFRIDFGIRLRETLKQIGISTIFSNGANFSHMLKEPNSKEVLPIDDILHKVCIEVNESGSEAPVKVANKPIVISNCIDSRKKFFRADHPFYFAIRSRDVIYFAGHVTKF